LRGYSRQDIDIRIRAGVLEEDVDYTIAPENLVGVRGSIVVTGADKHFDEVYVEIQASEIRLVDPTKKGYIKINLEQTALFGNDKDLMQANRHILTLEVTDGRAITTLSGLEMNWKTPDVNRPTQGDDIPVALDGASGYALVSLTWDTKTYNNLFYKVKDTPVKATVKLRAEPDRYFLGSIGPEDIQTVTSFTDGAPEVSDILVSDDGKTLQFVLSYDVFALALIKGTAVLGASIQINLDNYLEDLFEDQPEHRDPLPPVKVLLNSYFEVEGSVDKVWSGSVDKEKGYFVGVKGDPKARATATITLLPKVGYTFDGTDLVITDFVGSGKPIDIDNAATLGETLTNGPEGSLILTIVYEIEEKVIDPNDTIADYFNPNYLTRIARPLVGKPVRVGTPNAVSTDFVATEDSPYTGTVAWETGSDPFVRGKFGDSGVTATVTLVPKPGYKFDNTSGIYNIAERLSQAVAVDAPNATGTGLTSADPYALNFTLVYATPTNIKTQIRNLDGVLFNVIDPSVESGATPVSSSVVLGAPNSPFDSANNSNIGILGGLIPSTNLFQINTPATLRFFIKPADGYTFAADDGPLPYLTYGETLDEAGTAIKKLIEDHFSQVYNGTKLAADARVKSSTEYPPYLNADGELVLTLTYPAKPKIIEDTHFTIAAIGDLAIAPANNGDIPARLIPTIPRTIYDVSDIVWTLNGTVVSTGKFAAGTYTATITLTPKAGYTFIGSDLDDLEAALDDGTSGIWKTGGGTGIAVDDDDLTVTGVTVGATEDPVDPAKDKLVIKITFVIPAV
jgi:hypothetical protein